MRYFLGNVIFVSLFDLKSFEARWQIYWQIGTMTVDKTITHSLTSLSTMFDDLRVTYKHGQTCEFVFVSILQLRGRKITVHQIKFSKMKIESSTKFVDQSTNEYFGFCQILIFARPWGRGIYAHLNKKFSTEGEDLAAHYHEEHDRSIHLSPKKMNCWSEQSPK